MNRSRVALVSAAVGATAVLAAPIAASATPTPSEPLASGFAGPLQIDVGSHGQVYVAQDFIGVLTKVRPDGTTKDLVSDPGEIAGVASRGYDVAYTWTSGEAGTEPAALLKLRHANGKVRTVADILAFEVRHNPDAINEYGFIDLSKQCAAQVPPEVGGEPYSGIVESHPYALANAPGGGWWVADAAGNSILHVTKHGKVTVAAVMHPQRAAITAEVATAFGLPDCTLGKTYAFEPVPTDVEVGRNGTLYVSLLPGGPEDASLGARGQVVHVRPCHGTCHGRSCRADQFVVGRGFFGATNVAVSPTGRIFVSELFANQISTIKHGWANPLVAANEPAGLEFANGRLYASINVFGDGSVVTINP